MVESPSVFCHGVVLEKVSCCLWSKTTHFIGGISKDMSEAEVGFYREYISTIFPSKHLDFVSDV